MVYSNIKNLEQSGTVNPNPKGSNKALCFCVRDKIILYCFSRNNGQQFMYTYSEDILQTLMTVKRRMAFQQDSDLNTLAATKNFLRDNMPKVIDWPF